LLVQIEAEMRMARQSRARGNEGQARVCARRAAGLAIQIYRNRSGNADRPVSAYGLLRWFASVPGVEDGLRASAERLAMRVTHDHVLPHPQDPLADAMFLIQGLADWKPAI